MKRKKKDNPGSKLSSPLAMPTRQKSHKQGAKMSPNMPKDPALRSQMKKVNVLSSTRDKKKRSY
jgi:hypothetical protein